MKNPVKTWRNKCDKLITPIAIKFRPKCLLCGHKTQVGHHFIKKSESNALRYYIPNIISLCNHCHLALHNHETLYTSKITAIMELDWLNDLLEVKKKYTKVDVWFYKFHYELLSKLL